MIEFINRVASGLRKMDIKPDYLIFLDGIEDWTYDEKYLCGIPVLHTYKSINTGYSGENYIIHPAWIKEIDKEFEEVIKFQRGFYEYYEYGIHK